MMKVLPVTKRVLGRCCYVVEKRVLLQATGPLDGPLSPLWSAENISKWIHIHFPFFLVFVYGKKFYFTRTAGIVTPEVCLNVVVSKDEEAKPLSKKQSHSVLQVLPYGSTNWIKESNSTKGGRRLQADYNHSRYKNKEAV